MKKYLSKIITAALVVFVIATVVFCILYTSTSAQLSGEKTHVEQLVKINNEQLLLINKLGSLDGVNATVNFNINNKAVLGSIKTGDIQPLIENSMHYLRKEFIKNDTLVIGKRLVGYKSD
jgi:hypothetical protein